jgi:hypothetical protein
MIDSNVRPTKMYILGTRQIQRHTKGRLEGFLTGK